MLDLFVEFVALITHGNPLEPRTEATLIGCVMVSTAGTGICSPASTGSAREQAGQRGKPDAVGLDILMGVLGASDNALYCWPVFVTPIPDTAPQRPQLAPELGPFLWAALTSPRADSRNSAGASPLVGVPSSDRGDRNDRSTILSVADFAGFGAHGRRDCLRHGRASIRADASSRRAQQRQSRALNPSIEESPHLTAPSPDAPKGKA
jgi:hypothetical protein